MDKAVVMMKDIDERVRYIISQENMGVKRADVAQEQYQALLSVFSRIGGIPINTISKVSEHLQSKHMWTHDQLAAFSAGLRARVHAGHLQTPGNRPMQTNAYIEHYLTEDDWDRLPEKKTRDDSRDHRLEVASVWFVVP